MKEVMGVISPEGLARGTTSNISPHLSTLVGKTIGEVYNNHFKGELMFETYRRLFKEKYKNVKIIPFTEFPIVYVGGDAESQKRIAKEIAALAKEKGVDALITGNGGGGTCTPSSVRPAVEAERAGIPSVVITTTGFTTIAKAVAKAEGIADLRIGEYPGPVGVHPEELVVKNVENVLFDRIVDHLTKPRDGGSGKAPAATRVASEIIYEGNFADVNEYFRNQGWTDELPIIPPTVERVEAFLKHTDRAPDEKIAVLPQANLEAVPWNIAANGVMAGCSPECMPLLIAAVEAIADNTYNLANIGTTWGVFPFLLVNGPAAKKWAWKTAGN